MPYPPERASTDARLSMRRILPFCPLAAAEHGCRRELPGWISPLTWLPAPSKARFCPSRLRVLPERPRAPAGAPGLAAPAARCCLPGPLAAATAVPPPCCSCFGPCCCWVLVFLCCCAPACSSSASSWASCFTSTGHAALLPSSCLPFKGSAVALPGVACAAAMLLCCSSSPSLSASCWQGRLLWAAGAAEVAPAAPGAALSAAPAWAERSSASSSRASTMLATTLPTAAWKPCARRDRKAPASAKGSGYASSCCARQPLDPHTRRPGRPSRWKMRCSARPEGAAPLQPAVTSCNQPRPPPAHPAPPRAPPTPQPGRHCGPAPPEPCGPALAPPASPASSAGQQAEARPGESGHEGVGCLAAHFWGGALRGHAQRRWLSRGGQAGEASTINFSNQSRL